MSSPVWQRKLTNLAWEPLSLGRAREGRGSKAATDAGLNAGAQRRGSRRQACLIDILNPVSRRASGYLEVLPPKATPVRPGGLPAARAGKSAGFRVLRRSATFRSRNNCALKQPM